jgi:uncharacterized protein
VSTAGPLIEPHAEADARLQSKADRLAELVGNMQSVVVAYSGGVDSSYLAYVATMALDHRALCVTADSASYPERQRELALRVAREFGLHHEMIHTNEMARPEYRANPANRCYFCKHELYTHLTRIAAQRGFATVIDGNNADDRGDYRPGRQAAREFGVRSPLDEADLTKADIRELSRRVGLPTWEEPASACLSSRIPYESEVTDEKLQMIERAEAALHELGFRMCRVRHHGDIARVEVVADDIPRLVENELRTEVVRRLKALGYRFIALDLQGYRIGSLNEALRIVPIS